MRAFRRMTSAVVAPFGTVAASSCVIFAGFFRSGVSSGRQAYSAYAPKCVRVSEDLVALLEGGHVATGLLDDARELHPEALRMGEAQRQAHERLDQRVEQRPHPGRSARIFVSPM